LGDWGWGMGAWPQSPIPNPQSPIPNPQSPFWLNNNLFIILISLKNLINFLKIKNNLIIILYIL